MAADPALQREVLAACQAMAPIVLPEAPEGTRQVCQLFLLLPQGAELDEAIEAEMARLGVGAAVMPGAAGQSRLHEEAARAGHDATQPLVWTELVVFEPFTRVLHELDLSVATSLALTPDWSDVGRPKILAQRPDNSEGNTILQISVLLDGQAELQLLEDGAMVKLSPGRVVGTGTVCEASSPSAGMAGGHSYRLQARGTGIIDAGTLAIATQEWVQRTTPDAPRTSSRKPLG